jgi:hypothetical protein
VFGSRQHGAAALDGGGTHTSPAAVYSRRRATHTTCLLLLLGTAGLRRLWFFGDFLSHNRLVIWLFGVSTSHISVLSC